MVIGDRSFAAAAGRRLWNGLDVQFALAGTVAAVLWVGATVHRCLCIEAHRGGAVGEAGWLHARPSPHAVQQWPAGAHCRYT